MYFRAVLAGAAGYFVGGIVLGLILSLFGVPDYTAGTIGGIVGIFIGLGITAYRWKQVGDVQALAKREEPKVTDWDYHQRRRELDQ